MSDSRSLPWPHPPSAPAADGIVGSGGHDIISGGYGADWLAGAPLPPNWSAPNNFPDLTFFALPGAPAQGEGLYGGAATPSSMFALTAAGAIRSYGM